MFDLIYFQNLFEAQKSHSLSWYQYYLQKKNETFMFSNAGETQLVSVQIWINLPSCSARKT